MEHISFETIELLVEEGGKVAVLKEDENGCNDLHHACENEHISFKVIELLVEVGGKTTVLQQV